MSDCSLYALSHKDIDVIFTEDGPVFDVGPNDFKYLYIGITNNIDIRWKQHLQNTSNPEYLTSRKLYNRLRVHGWDAYDKVILRTGLTRDEANAIEIETIALYRTFELGLNSTPGGDGVGWGADHPNATAVNVYDNLTGDISSFLCTIDAAIFLGVNASVLRNVVCDVVAKSQTYSPVFNRWFQIKKVNDDTPFVENMPTFGEKIAKSKREPIVVVNLETREELEFGWVGEAAEHFNISEGNIQSVLSKSHSSKQFHIGKNRYDVQKFPKTREWNFYLLPKSKEISLRQRKSIVIVNLETREELEFGWIGEAAEYFDIPKHNIKNVLYNYNKYKQFYVKDRRYDVQKSPKTREWDFSISSKNTNKS
ncbi:GIY-YIG catalytic domain-containing endonuclease [Paramecium bursaria Chlorella virus Can18-4]|nr:GIY-YIG catalytic domain-containing endonuclease [Paramecium bursaria Chlorella virus Can18-4]